MVSQRVHTLRSVSLVVATITLGISWSFAIFHIRTAAYPLLWSAAMPLLAFYYFASGRRFGTWKHLPAAALSIYAVVLWQVSRGYGAPGMSATVFGILASMAAVWLGGRASATNRSTRQAASTAPTAQRAADPVALGSGVARRRRLRSAGGR